MPDKLNVPAIVCPGLARSGTSYLYYQLTNQNNRKFFNVPRTKETNYFINEPNPNSVSFTSLYTDISSAKYCLDFSPSYLGWADAIHRICETLTPELTKIILNLRSPVDRAVSNYLHDLKVEVSTRQRGDNVSFSFFSREAQPKYLKRLASTARSLIEAFGRDNVFVVNFHKDIVDPVRLRNRLSSFLGIELGEFSSEHVSPGGWLPYYLYSEDHLRTEIILNGEIRSIPPGTLLLVNGNFSRRWDDISPSLAKDLMLASGTWTKMIDQPELSALRNILQKDFEEVLEMLGEDPRDYPDPASLVAAPAKIDESVFDTLPLQSQIPDHSSLKDEEVQLPEPNRSRDHMVHEISRSEAEKKGVTREEIIYGYRFILGREPESESVIESKLWVESWQQLRELFLSSDEFRTRFEA